MSSLFTIPIQGDPQNEPAIEAAAFAALQAAGYGCKTRKCGNPQIDAAWPSKQPPGRKPRPGEPDLLICFAGTNIPVCVWDNKGPGDGKALEGLNDAKFYIDGLFTNLPHIPGLPRLAVGYNGQELLIEYKRPNGSWTSVKLDNEPLYGQFPMPAVVRNGISSAGVFTATNGCATATDLRGQLEILRTVYRNIPILASGRVPIDFTVALLTLKMLTEQQPDWGAWSEQPALVVQQEPQAAIRERLLALIDRVLRTGPLRERYGAIFQFEEKSGEDPEVAFSCADVVRQIPLTGNHFTRFFTVLDDLPPLTGADFDVFGEVYQALGDEATKKKLGQFFTGRHIIGAVVPVVMHRAGFALRLEAVSAKRIADVACGTGGFLTETLRFLRRRFQLDEAQAREVAESAFFGYDLSHASASRARVNMYFAGDGFSTIEGGCDTLRTNPRNVPDDGFDMILTNPPYGRAGDGRLEEKFARRVMELLRAGDGWCLIVLPVGLLENPRSKSLRFHLLKTAQITDVIALPRHAFAPYTQQRTAIVLLHKRTSPLAVPDGQWPALIMACGHERLSLFIVDNDGYANSDKRYRTGRKNDAGEWLHDDLSPWVDADGVRHAGKLYSALVEGRQVAPAQADLFSGGAGPKHSEVRLSDLVDEHRGINLLPDPHLRPPISTLAYPEFRSRVQALSLYCDEGAPLTQPFADETRRLLGACVETEEHGAAVALNTMVSGRKGDQGLTEDVQYYYYDPNGLPVYGGGFGAPRFRIAREAITKRGRPVTVFAGPAILVSMDGSSGSMQVVLDAEFCANHHAMVLHRRNGIDVDLDWLVQHAQARLRCAASNKGASATLTIAMVNHLLVDRPTHEADELEIGDLRRQLCGIARRFGVEESGKGPGAQHEDEATEAVELAE